MDYTSESDDDVYIGKKISDIIKNNKKKKVLYINSFSLYDDDSTDDEDFSGGYKLNIPKTFVNKLSRNIKVKRAFKNYTLNEIYPVGKEVIMATIVDYNFIKKDLKSDFLTEKELVSYLTKGDWLPLIYGDTDTKNIIYIKQVVNKGKKKIVRSKKTIFSENNKPLVFFFKVGPGVKFYKPVKKENEDNDVSYIENKAVVQYIIGRYFMLIPNPKENLKIKSVHSIVFKNDVFEMKHFKDDAYEFGKMNIEDFENILNLIVKQCTKFE